MTKKTKTHMGHDPLAWMSEEESQSQQITETNASTDENIVEAQSPQIVDAIAETKNQALSTNDEQTMPDNEITEESSKIIPSNNQWITINLPPVLTLTQLEAVKNDLVQHLGQRVELIGNEVKKVDTASLQLLYSFMQHPEITVSWVSPSAELYQAARFLGMSSHLNLPVHGEN